MRELEALQANQIQRPQDNGGRWKLVHLKPWQPLICKNPAHGRHQVQDCSLGSPEDPGPSSSCQTSRVQPCDRFPLIVETTYLHSNPADFGSRRHWCVPGNHWFFKSRACADACPFSRNNPKKWREIPITSPQWIIESLINSQTSWPIIIISVYFSYIYIIQQLQQF